MQRPLLHPLIKNPVRAQRRHERGHERSVVPNHNDAIVRDAPDLSDELEGKGYGDGDHGHGDADQELEEGEEGDEGAHFGWYAVVCGGIVVLAGVGAM